MKQHILELRDRTPPDTVPEPVGGPLRHFGERSLPLSAAVREAIAASSSADQLRVYPRYDEVLERLADYCDVPREQLMVTNGSDQGIELTMRASCSAGDEIIIPAPSFFMYFRYARVEGLSIVRARYAADCRFPIEAALGLLTERTRLIVVPNPSTLAGVVTPVDQILRLAEVAKHCVILVDECHFELTGVSVKDHLRELDNLVIARTMSKTWGLAALRLGYLISSSRNIAALRKLRGPYDVNSLAVAAAAAALDERHRMRDYVARMTNEIRPGFEAFLRERGVAYRPSQAHYVFITPSDPAAVSRRLAQLGVTAPVRTDPAGTPGLRIGLGTAAQTREITTLLAAALS